MQEIDDAISYVDATVTTDMNSIIDSPFVASEIYKEVFELHPSKAPGPDGFTELFFQATWTFI